MKYPKKDLFKVTVWALLAFFIFSVQTYGGQCRMMEFCQAYNNAESIFEGKLIAVTNDNYVGVRIIADFEIVKSYKGIPGKVERAIFRGGDYPHLIFKIGEHYLVYKDKELGGLAYCNRTQGFSESSPDLGYLQDVSGSQPYQLISGRIFIFSQPYSSPLPDLSALDIKVELRGGGELYRQAVEADGYFIFKLKKKAEYKVDIMLPTKPINGRNDFKIQKTHSGFRAAILETLTSAPCTYKEFGFSLPSLKK